MSDAYYLPRIDETLDALAGSKYFSSLDLKSGYWQVVLEESCKKYGNLDGKLEYGHREQPREAHGVRLSVSSHKLHKANTLISNSQSKVICTFLSEK